jgi:hypothetical protein
VFGETLENKLAFAPRSGNYKRIAFVILKNLLCKGKLTKA